VVQVMEVDELLFTVGHIIGKSCERTVGIQWRSANGTVLFFSIVEIRSKTELDVLKDGMVPGTTVHFWLLEAIWLFTERFQHLILWHSRTGMLKEHHWSTVAT